MALLSPRAHPRQSPWKKPITGKQPCGQQLSALDIKSQFITIILAEDWSLDDEFMRPCPPH